MVYHLKIRCTLTFFSFVNEGSGWLKRILVCKSTLWVFVYQSVYIIGQTMAALNSWDKIMWIPIYGKRGSNQKPLEHEPTKSDDMWNGSKTYKKHKSTIAEMQNTNAKGFNIFKTFTLSTFFGRFVNQNTLKTADRPDINRMQWSSENPSMMIESWDKHLGVTDGFVEFGYWQIFQTVQTFQNQQMLQISTQYFTSELSTTPAGE